MNNIEQFKIHARQVLALMHRIEDETGCIFHEVNEESFNEFVEATKEKSLVRMRNIQCYLEKMLAEIHDDCADL